MTARARPSPCSWSFNGAALRRARILRSGWNLCSATAPLQRGRAPESADIRPPGAMPVSGGKLQRGRAPESADIDDVAPLVTLATTASTGPRSGERGYGLLRRIRPKLLGLLQRGRAPESADICRHLSLRRPICIASTGPRSGERGYAPAENSMETTAKASTGPRSGERGYVAKCRTFWGDVPLQRGRAPESADIKPSPVSRRRSILLQRGRAPESADIFYLCRS